MAFVDRIVEYPNRYILEDENGVQTGPYTLIRDEGEVTEAGTLLNAQNLNDEVDALITAKLPEVVSNTVSAGTVAAGGYKNVDIPITPPDGKTAVGIAGVYISGTNQSYCSTIGFYIGSDGNAHVQLKNTYTGSVSWSVRAWAICV